MFKALKKAQKGFTIIELLIVIAIIAILALLVINNVQGGQAKARDQQRINDINAIKNKLEERYNENSTYPATLTTATIPGIEAEALNDPAGGNAIAVSSGSADAAAADGVAAPTSDRGDTASYLYIPYDCTDGECSGYRLKTFIEKPNANTGDQPFYIQNSLN